MLALLAVAMVAAAGCLEAPPEDEILPPVPDEPIGTIPEQLGNTSCYAVIPDHNEPDQERINIVFVGFEMEEEEFVSMLPLFVDYNGTGLTTQVEERQKITTEGETEVFTENRTFTFRGLLGTEPFASGRQKFNFWYVDGIQPVSERQSDRGAGAFCSIYCQSNAAESCGLANTYPVHLCNATCTPFGSWTSNRAYISHLFLRNGSFNPYAIRIFVHEFGHSFGGLRDEYVHPERGFGPPNCAPDLVTAREWWGDLIGQGEGELTVGYFEGCGASEEYIRPTNKSLMRMTSSPMYDFGPVNEWHLQQLLDQYSGGYRANLSDIDPVPTGNRTDREKPG